MSSLGHLDQLLGYNLKRAQHRLNRKLEDALRSSGLTAAQYAVLSALQAKPDQTNADLANAAFITPQSMQGVLSKLEDAGHVVRDQDENHGRRQLARLTASGESLVTKGRQSASKVEEALAHSVHPFSVGDALDLLRRMQNAME